MGIIQDVFVYLPVHLSSEAKLKMWTDLCTFRSTSYFTVISYVNQNVDRPHAPENPGSRGHGGGPHFDLHRKLL
jgi:hypothetical protein